MLGPVLVPPDAALGFAPDVIGLTDVTGLAGAWLWPPDDMTVTVTPATTARQARPTTSGHRQRRRVGSSSGQ